MLKFGPLSAIIALLLSPVVCRAEDMPPVAATDTVTSPTIGVADFTGSDPDRGRFLAETLLTDMSQSAKLQLVERTEIKHALDELKLQSTGLFDPGQVKQLGKLVRADHLIVGSYMENGDQMIVNARLLNVETGRVAPGGGANVVGSRKDLLTLVHRLAHMLHRRITGEDFILEGEPDPARLSLDDLLPHPKTVAEESVDAQATPVSPPKSPAGRKPPRKEYAVSESTNELSENIYLIPESDKVSHAYTPQSDSKASALAPTTVATEPLLSTSGLQEALNYVYSPSYFYSYSYSAPLPQYQVSFGQNYLNCNPPSNQRYHRTYNNSSTYNSGNNYIPGFSPNPGWRYTPSTGGPTFGIQPQPPYTPPTKKYRLDGDDRARG